MEDSTTKATGMTGSAEWKPLRSALSLGPEDLQKYTFLGVVICHGGERIYAYRDVLNQRCIYVDQTGNFHCGTCFPAR